MEERQYTVGYINNKGLHKNGTFYVPYTGKKNHDDGVLVAALVKNYLVAKIVTIEEVV